MPYRHVVAPDEGPLTRTLPTMTTAGPRRKASCAACGGTVRAKDRFCPNCGAPIAAAQAAPVPPSIAGPADRPDSVSLQVPGLGRDTLGEQRKVVTILFADLSGSTPLAEKLDPEDLRRILASYFNQLAGQIRRYEGTIDKYIGDAVMAVFGAPLSHEDDAERAIRAALAMQGSIAKLNDDLDREHGVRLALRIGINTGEVVAGLLGGDVQSAYTVVGDAVNTAQRFESIAPLGQILVSETTRRLAMHAFEFETLPPVTLKGKAEPVRAFRVIRRRDEEVEPDASPLVGREAELIALRGHLGEALYGRGRVLHLSGEAGVGKSRLVSEFRSDLAGGVERMSARCASYETQTPYALVADLVRGAFRIHGADDRATARELMLAGMGDDAQAIDDAGVVLLLDVLGYGEASTQDPQHKQRMLIAILRTLLARTGARGPFVIVVEDLHWVDNGSIAVMTELVKDIPALPALFISTSRASWTPPWTAVPMELLPLRDSDARSLIEAVVDLPVEAHLAEAILARTGGNPFFIEEVVRELQTTGAVRESSGQLVGAAGAGTRLPATIQEVLEARLDRLADGPKRVVRPAAVVGRSFWLRLIEQLVPGVPLAEDLAELERESFIVTRSLTPELTYVFRQALTQEVVYQTQLLSDRRRLHGAVAAAIEAVYPERLDEFTDLLAYHYERSDETAKAVTWLVRAGDRAKSLFANAEALVLFDSALARSGDGVGAGRAAGILERIADVLVLTGRYDEALARLSAARERGPEAPPADRARLWRKTGTALLMKAAYSEATAAFAAAREALGNTDDVEAAHIELQAGQLAWRRGDYESARIALSEAVRVGESLAAGDAVAEGLKQLGNVSFLAGRRDDAAEFYRRSLEMYERLADVPGLAAVHSNLGVLYRRMARWDAALAELAASLQLRERMGDPWGVGTIHNNIGEVHRTRGELDAAIAAYERAIATWEPIGYASGVALALTGLGAAIAEAGDARRGREILRDAETRWAELGSTTYLPDLYRFVASAELAGGDAEAAARAAERSTELARAAEARHQEAMTTRVRGEIALARGDRDEARRLLEQSIRELRELDEPTELARAEAVLARLD